MHILEGILESFVGVHAKGIQIFSDCASAKQDWYLWNHRHFRAERVQPKCGNIHSTQRDASVLAFQQSKERLNEGRLATACTTNDTDAFATGDMKGGIVQ